MSARCYCSSSWYSVVVIVFVIDVVSYYLGLKVCYIQNMISGQILITKSVPGCSSPVLGNSVTIVWFYNVWIWVTSMTNLFWSNLAYHYGAPVHESVYYIRSRTYVRVHIYVRLKDERLLSEISPMMSGPWILYLVRVKGVSFFFCLRSSIHTLHLLQCYTIVTKSFSSSSVPSRSPCKQTEVKINLLSHPYHIRCLLKLNRSRIVQNTRIAGSQGLFSRFIPTFSCSWKLETSTTVIL